MPRSYTADAGQASASGTPSTPRHLPFVPASLLKPPSPPRFLPWEKKEVGGVGFQVFIVDAFLVRDGAEGQAFPGEGRGGQASRGGGGAERRRVGETSLLSDLQFPRHLTEGAGQTKGEGCPVLPDGALEGGRERLAALTWHLRRPVPQPSAPTGPGRARTWMR